MMMSCLLGERTYLVGGWRDKVRCSMRGWGCWHTSFWKLSYIYSLCMSRKN